MSTAVVLWELIWHMQICKPRHANICICTHQDHTLTNTHKYTLEFIHNTSSSEETSVLGSAFQYLPLYNHSLPHYYQMCRATISLFIKNSSGARVEDIPPSSTAAWMMQSCVLSLRETDFRFHLWTLREGWRSLHTATLCGGQRGSRRRTTTVRFQLKQTNKQTHELAQRNLSLWLSVCLCLFVCVCICVFCNSLCTCVHCWFCNANTAFILMGKKGLTPYLHPCRASDVTNTPL